jgi:hypothetical protein
VVFIPKFTNNAPNIFLVILQKTIKKISGGVGWSFDHQK